MEQLTVLDAGFLEAEDSDRHVSLAIGAIAVLAVPRLRQVLRRQTLDLSAPGWVPWADMDISHHVRRAAPATAHWRSTPVGTLKLVQGG